jgi:hypothetical protein
MTRARQRIEDDWWNLDRIGLDIELNDLHIPSHSRDPLYALAAEVRARVSVEPEKNEGSDVDG